MKNFVLFFLLCCSYLTSTAQGFGTRESINTGWFFKLGDGKYWGAEFFNHSKWRKLDVPHDWSIEMQANPNLASCTGYFPGGIGWYRRELQIPAEAKGKKVYVYFEGVYNNSEVFINGKWIGKRPNGYVSFMYDLTPYVNFGGRNVIAVRVDHSQDADSRWYTGSGIYRDVYLVYANPVHINLWGVSYETKVKRNSAVLTVKTEIDNNADKNLDVEVFNRVFDREGKIVNQGKQTFRVMADKVSGCEMQLDIQSPKLWSIDNPYLYTIVTEVKRNGKIVDKSETRAGIRKLTFDADKGFALNDQPMKIKGVCIHHDAGCLGAAVPKEVWQRRLKSLKGIGCNAIRMSHNPQATCVYELCDEMGFLVMDEAFDEWEYPKKKWISGWNKGKPGFQGSAIYFREWNKRDLADMIRRDRNHPSVIMWSIGNEVDYPNDPYSHPILDEEGISQHHVKGYQPNQPRAERLGEIAKELVAEAKRYDTSRPVTAALAGAVMSNETAYPRALDIVGYNYTEYRYKKDHEKYPDRVLYGSETRHDLNAWKAVRDNEFIMGQFIWTGFDYLGEAGPWPSRGFTTGMIDLAGYIKPNGYFRRSLWEETPNIYIGTYSIGNNKIRTNAPAVWNYEDGEMIRVVAYTNCEEAELFLNGVQVGVRKPYDETNGVIYWDVPYRRGKLTVKGYTEGSKVADYSIQSSRRPFAIKAKADKTKGLKPGDVIHVEIFIVDKDEVSVVLADNLVKLSISGPAKLLGLESGEGNVADNFRDNKQRCMNGRLLGYLKMTGAGEVRIKAESALLKKFEIAVTVE
mgnify:FL=1